ncbi:MAG: class I tRNA ligase family protein [Marinilabiliales bacterium]|nr:class I tRNA ligase family protein [Marinilabiliales bacterium]
MKRYPEYKNLDLTRIGNEIRGVLAEARDRSKRAWNSARDEPPYIFYEGPPSANGIPGIHHVMARAIKDIFCRYKTMKGFYVEPQGRLGHPRTSGGDRRREKTGDHKGGHREEHLRGGLQQGVPHRGDEIQGPLGRPDHQDGLLGRPR